MRAFLLVLAALLGLALLLGALGVVELPLGLSGGGEEQRPDAGLAVRPPAVAGGGARLEGLGGAPRVAADDRPGSVAHGTVLRGATLVGRVVESGVTPMPVAGARLRLSRPHPVTAFLKTPSDGRWDALEVESDDRGEFRFVDVRPARGYVVRASLAGRAAASSARLDLVARQVVDLGDLTLAPGGVLEGRVLDDRRLPVSAARVAVTWEVESILGMLVADPDALPEREAEALTDDGGNFRLVSLEAGVKTLVVSSGGHGGLVVGEVRVVAERTLELDDILLAGRGVVAGRVEWSDGTPVEGARVVAGEPRFGKPTLTCVVTGPDGTFHLEHLAGDTARVGAFVPGIPVEPATVPLGTLDHVIRLAPPGSLAGRVVARASGEPVKRFSVELEPAAEDGWLARAVRRLVESAVGPQGFASADGRFQIPLHGSGRWVAIVRADGYPELRTEPFEIPARERVDVGTIALAEGFALAGIVRGRLGGPLAGARIHLLGPGSDVRVDGADILHGEAALDRPPDAVSDGEGAFALPPQTPGMHALFVQHAQALPRLVEGVDLTHGPRTGLDVVLEPAGEVRVRVLDARGRPAAGEDVLLVRPDRFALDGATDAHGLLHWTSVAAGPCVVRWASIRETRQLRTAAYSDDEAARRDAYEALAREAPETLVRAGEPTDVLLQLPARVQVTLRVTPWAATVKPIERVILWQRASYWRRSAVPSAEGTFVLMLEPGTYEIRAVPADGWDASRVFEGVVIPDAPSHSVELGR